MRSHDAAPAPSQLRRQPLAAIAVFHGQLPTPRPPCAGRYKLAGDVVGESKPAALLSATCARLRACLAAQRQMPRWPPPAAAAVLTVDVDSIGLASKNRRRDACTEVRARASSSELAGTRFSWPLTPTLPRPADAYAKLAWVM